MQMPRRFPAGVASTQTRARPRQAGPDSVHRMKRKTRGASQRLGSQALPLRPSPPLPRLLFPPRPLVPLRVIHFLLGHPLVPAASGTVAGRAAGELPLRTRGSGAKFSERFFGRVRPVLPLLVSFRTTMYAGGPARIKAM